MLEQRITQPGMQPCAYCPPRELMVSYSLSPLRPSAPSKLPALKLRVGSPPSLFTFIRVMAVPYLGNFSPVTGCALSRAAKSRIRALVASGSWGRNSPPSSSMITAFKPLAPATAPSPPRPRLRQGSPSGSVTLRQAVLIRISPAGPAMIRPTRAPKRSRRASAVG